MIRLRFLGGAVLTADGLPITGSAAHRHRIALLALLSRAPAGELSREKLAVYLWPEADAKHSRNLLRVSLHALRQTLGHEAILSVGEDLRLNESLVSADVRAFERAMEDAELDRAVELYSGPFLDGFHLPDAPELERWVDGERSALGRRYGEALEGLALAAAERGDTVEAVRWWERVAAHDPFDSRVALALMRARAAAGNPAGAVQHARLHERLVREELGAQPDPSVSEYVSELTAELPRSQVALRGPTVRESPLGAVDSALPPAPPTESSSTSAEIREAGIAETPSPRAYSGTRASMRLRLAGVAAAVLALATVLFVVGGESRSPDGYTGSGLQHEVNRSHAAVPAGERPRVLVLEFGNPRNDPALEPLGGIAADWIVQGLARTGRVEVVSPLAALRMAEAIREERGTLDEEAVAQVLAEKTEADILVSGSMSQRGDTIAYQAQIANARTGIVLRSLEAVRGPAEAPLKGVEALRQRVTGALATVLDPRLASWAAAASQPPSFEAYQLYADGIARYVEGGQGSVARAAEQFERASALDSTFTAPLIWAVLVQRWNLAKSAWRDSALAVLAERRERLEPWDRAMVDYLVAFDRADWEGAYRAMEGVVAVTPDSDWLFFLAEAALWTARPRTVVELLSRLDPERGLMKDWPLYCGYLLPSLHWIEAYDRELREAKRCRSLYPQDQTVVVYELTALVGMGQWEEAVRRGEEMLVSGRSAALTTRLILALVRELRAHGRPAVAQRMADRLVEWLRVNVSEEERSQHQFQRRWGRVLYAAGRFGEARGVFGSLLAQDPTDWPYPAHLRALARQEYLAHLALIAARQGEREKAMQLWDQVESIENPWRQGGGTADWRVRLAAQLLEPEQALRVLREAVGEHGLPRTQTYEHEWDLEPLWGHSAFREFMRPKG